MNEKIRELIDAANDSIADFTWDHGDIIPQEIRELLQAIQQQQDIAAEHEMVREQLGLSDTDPLPAYRILEGTVINTSLTPEGTNSRSQHHALIEKHRTMTEHALVRRQLELGPDDPLPEYRIEHGTVYDMSLAIQRSINRMESF